MAKHTVDTASITKEFLAAAGLALLGLLASAGTAAADGVDASSPAIIDDDGFQNYATSSWPAGPSWPAGSSFPADSSFPGSSSHPCCSR